MQRELDFSTPSVDLMHHGGNSESQAAYERVDVTKMRRLVYERLEAVGDATADELAAAMGLPHNSVAPRLTELKARNMVRQTGERRKTRSGAMAAVLKVNAG